MRKKKIEYEEHGGANRRLQQYRKFLGLTQTQFAEKVNITQANLSYLEKNPAQTPSGSLIQSIITSFPDLNLNWWFFGEGEMLRSDEMKKLDNVPTDVKVLLKELDNVKREKEMIEFQLSSSEREKAFLQKLLLKDKETDAKEIFEEKQQK